MSRNWSRAAIRAASSFKSKTALPSTIRGDTAYFQDMKTIGEEFRIDVALLFIGGHSGMGPQIAAKRPRRSTLVWRSPSITAICRASPRRERFRRRAEKISRSVLRDETGPDHHVSRREVAAIACGQMMQPRRQKARSWRRGCIGARRRNRRVNGERLESAGGYLL